MSPLIESTGTLKVQEHVVTVEECLTKKRVVKTHTFAVVEYASLHIPRIDRISTDLQRLPCVVVQVLGKAQEMYRLRCKYGVLRTCFRAGDLESFKGSHGIPVKEWENQPRITLREAARQQSPWNSFTKENTATASQVYSCDTGRCFSKKNSIECSTCTATEDFSARTSHQQQWKI